MIHIGQHIALSLTNVVDRLHVMRRQVAHSEPLKLALAVQRVHCATPLEDGEDVGRFFPHGSTHYAEDYFDHLAAWRRVCLMSGNTSIIESESIEVFHISLSKLDGSH